MAVAYGPPEACRAEICLQDRDDAWELKGLECAC